MDIRHVVYSHRDGLRWYFLDTMTQRKYLLSLNLSDIKYLKYGVNILVPPFSKNHIKGNW